MTTNTVPGISALQYVISSLRDTAHLSDEEGELTDQLQELRDWALSTAAQPAVQQGEPLAWMGDGTLRVGSEATAYRVVTDATKRGMTASLAASFITPLYAHPAAPTAQPPTNGGDPANPRDDSDRSYNKPVGYLTAYELIRLHSGHGAQLRSARFGPSALDGDVPVYLVARLPNA